MAKKINIREIKSKIKIIEKQEETLEGDVERADQEIFQDLDSVQVEGGEADALGASQARIPAGLESTAESFLGRQSQAANSEEEMTSARLYEVGRNLGEERRTPYNPNATTASATMVRRKMGDFAERQEHMLPENEMMDTQLRMRHKDVGDEEDKYNTTDLDKQEKKKDRYWV